MKKRYLCIHGHFYQPPRENPWSGKVKRQPSAHPYHDWNQRITAECYAPNAASRVLDQDRLIGEVNNYQQISFNFGPTLLSWMELEAPDVYRSILEADRHRLAGSPGHGSAIAQAYNHVILPLATARQKRLQIKWGVADFEHRFGRFPEGFWLPETAVDVATLDSAAQAGIRFVILAPHQAARVRPPGGAWLDVNESTLDTTRAYLFDCPSGASIALFFYNATISRGIAFDGLLKDGSRFAAGLIDGFSDAEGPQLVHAATDGETYGHHHRFGEMALSFALREIRRHDLAQVTSYGEYLDIDPPQWEAEIRENTSWSCPHGIERWRSDCGCSSGAYPDWKQTWRKPLREALEFLSESLEQDFFEKSVRWWKEPEEALDHYLELILDSKPDKVQRFAGRYAARPLSREDEASALNWLEMMRQVQLSFTSCAWFFDDIGGIEPTQSLCHAARALQLARDLSGVDFETRFLERLAHARSNDPKISNARRVYQTQVSRRAVLRGS